MTGPELFELGAKYLGKSGEYQRAGHFSGEISRETAQTYATMASAAFAGALAAAFAPIGGDESNSAALAQQWRAVVGDTQDPEVPR